LHILINLLDSTLISLKFFILSAEANRRKDSSKRRLNFPVFFLLVLLAVEVVLLKQVFEYLDSILKRFGVPNRKERKGGHRPPGLFSSRLHCFFDIFLLSDHRLGFLDVQLVLAHTTTT